MKSAVIVKSPGRLLLSSSSSCLIGNAVVKIHGVERASSKSIGYFSSSEETSIEPYSVPLGKAWLNVAEVHLKCQHKLSVDNSHITFWPIPTPNFWEFARDPAIPKLKRSGELGQVVSLESQYNNCWRFPLTTHLLLSFYCGNELFSADNNYN